MHALISQLFHAAFTNKFIALLSSTILAWSIRLHYPRLDLIMDGRAIFDKQTSRAPTFAPAADCHSGVFWPMSMGRPSDLEAAELKSPLDRAPRSRNRAGTDQQSCALRRRFALLSIVRARAIGAFEEDAYCERKAGSRPGFNVPQLGQAEVRYLVMSRSLLAIFRLGPAYLLAND
jgi:hypothetical protein